MLPDRSLCWLERVSEFEIVPFRVCDRPEGMGRKAKQCNTVHGSTAYQCPVASWGVPCPVPMLTYVSSWGMPCPLQMPPYQQQVALPTTEAKDDKVEELKNTKEKLYQAREKVVYLQERLTLALLKNDDLEGQLVCCKICLKDARLQQEKIARELANMQRDDNPKRIYQVRTTFANGGMGDKIERLANDEAVSLKNLAEASVAQHRKMSKLLTTLKNRYDLKFAEQQASEATHAGEIAALESALATTQAELSQSREETTLFRQHAQKLEEHIASHQKSRAEAESQVATFEKKIATLTKKQARSKEISAKLYEEKKKLQEKRSFGECSVCFEEGNLMTFVPCGHAAVCLSCGAEIAKCPICTTHVDARAPLYFCV